tara:strand:+ start:981 stop:1118 length:138 start_codon:yes stop_codon:yes gene_type:complete
MKEKKFKVDGIEYTVRSTTKEGLKRAEREFKRSIKKNNEDKGHGI